MTALRKPKAATPEAFTRLAMECRNSISLTKTEITKQIHIAPQTFHNILNGKFAKQDFENMTPKQLSGAVSTLARFCQYFNLDLASCFEACGIPSECLDFYQAKHPKMAELGVRKYSTLLITKDIWEKIGQIIDAVGVLPLSQVNSLIETLHKNSDPPE